MPVTPQYVPLCDVLSRCGRGSQDDSATLYDATSAQIHALVLRIVNDPARAETVTQAVFLDIWRFSPSFDSANESALTWLLRLTHQTSIDYVRSASRP